MNGDEKKKYKGFGGFMRAVFVHNIGYKLLALALGAVVWVITVGL